MATIIKTGSLSSFQPQRPCFWLNSPMFKAVKRLMDLKQNYGYVRVIKKNLRFFLRVILVPRINDSAKG